MRLAPKEQAVTGAHVVNVLYRRAQQPAAPVLQVHEALKLTVEPAANCARCDRLLQPLPITPVPLNDTQERAHAHPTDRSAEEAAPARHGQRPGGELIRVSAYHERVGFSDTNVANGIFAPPVSSGRNRRLAKEFSARSQKPQSLFHFFQEVRVHRAIAKHEASV